MKFMLDLLNSTCYVNNERYVVQQITRILKVGYAAARGRRALNRPFFMGGGTNG